MYKEMDFPVVTTGCSFFFFKDKKNKHHSCALMPLSKTHLGLIISLFALKSCLSNIIVCLVIPDKTVQILL